MLCSVPAIHAGKPSHAPFRRAGKSRDAPENREKMRVPLEIRDVRIENGELVVEHR